MIVPHPEVRKITEENTLLRDELARLLTEAHDLVTVTKPNLLALYQTKIGAWELQLLKAQVEVARLKRKLELAQVSINHGDTPNWGAIERQLQEEFLVWQKKVQEAAQSLEKAEFRLNHLLSPAEDRELKSLYYALVKILHPDLNPALTEDRRLLWLRVQTAYEESDIEGLKALTLVSKDFVVSPAATSLEALQAERASLNKQIAAVLKRIDRINQQPPFTLKSDIYDEGWVATRRRELETKIADVRKQQKLFLSLLQPIMPRYGDVFGSN